MSGQPYAPSLTAEDYYNLPDNGMRFQLIEGELSIAPAPNLYHQTNPLEILPHAAVDVVFHGERMWQPERTPVRGPKRWSSTNRVKGAGFEPTSDIPASVKYALK
jgi:hypothetical protein